MASGDQATTPENKISKQMLKTLTGQFDIESIFVLSLKQRGLTELGCIGKCAGLEILDLSGNEVSSLHGLSGLKELTNLNLSSNRIHSLDGLQSLEKLEKLNLAENFIASVSALQYLTSLDNLTSLRLRDPLEGLTNPICTNPSYQPDVTSLLPNLISLDGERLKGDGSEVFKIMQNMDQKTPVLGVAPRCTPPAPPTPWVPPSYWLPPTEFEKSSLGDAEEQLKALLVECSRMSKEVDRKLEALQNEPP